MNLGLTVIEDFYVNPEEVRAFALDQEFNVTGNYPGRRTVSHADASIKGTMEDALKGMSGKIIHFPLGEKDEGDGVSYEPSDEDTEEKHDNYNGAYQFTTSEDRTWIHCDSWNNWAAVCYLTPDAPLTGGTALYRHKSTGLYGYARKPDGSEDKETMDLIWSECGDKTKWDLVDFVANKFNRLVLYRGDLFHASMDYFGKDKYDGRLFQTFFFNTEW